MKHGYKTIIWGFIILKVHLTIGNIAILPQFIAWSIILRGIKELYYFNESRELNIAKKITLVCVYVTLGLFLVPFWIPQLANNYVFTGFLPVLYYILEFMTEFYILAGSVAWMNKYNYKVWEQDYTKRTTIYTIAVLCNILISSLAYTSLIAEFVMIAGIMNLVLTFIYLKIISSIRQLDYKNYLQNNYI